MATYTARELSKPKGKSASQVKRSTSRSRSLFENTGLADYCRATGKFKKIAEPCKRFTLTGTLFLIPQYLSQISMLTRSYFSSLVQHIGQH